MSSEFNSFKQPEDEKKSESSLEGFGKSLLNSAMQNPINSVSQIGSELSGIKLPEMHYFDPAEPADGTQRFAQQAGAVVGMLVPFMISHKAVSFSARKMNIELGGSALASAGEQAATGAFMGFALTPTNEGFSGRLKHGLIDAGTFGVMGGASSKLASTFGVAAEAPLASRVMRKSLLGIGAGMPAGFVNAELTSLAEKGQFASTVEVRDNVAAFAMLGGIFGGVEGLRPLKEVKTPGEATKKFPEYSASQLKIGRQIVEQELAQVKGSSENGNAMSVLDKFNQSNLSDAQKERVLNAMAAVRENHVGARSKDGKIDPDQEKNWIHTQGEFGRNIDSARRMNLTPEQTEDTLIGSMFSDAVKHRSNFMVHHRDGREAAQTFLSYLSQNGLSAERVKGIGNMILEHQIGPPGFMRMIYANNISADINVERSHEFATLLKKAEVERTPTEQVSFEKLRVLSDAYDARTKELANFSGSDFDRSQLAHRQTYGRFVTDEEAAAIASLGHKIASPLQQPVVDTAYGGKGIELTELERALLRRTGNDEWFVPHESTPWYAASRSLINADSIDNYATPGGFSKLVGMNGPETDIFFRDKTLAESLASPKRSFNFAYDIMTPEGKALADIELAKTDQAIQRALGRTETWLRQEKNIPAEQPLPEIPFWNTELVYPERGAFENEWWKLHKNSARTPEQQQQWEDGRFTGLSTEQVDHFLFAKRIRDRMVDELRREQRVDGSLPPEYAPVMQRR